MPQFATKHFGLIEYSDEAVLEFPAGLPGFESEDRFLALEQPGIKPVVFLQSLKRPELCFITLPVHVVDPDYVLSVAPEDLRVLALADDRQPEIGREVLCLTIVSVAEDRQTTVNLLAPIVVNLKTRCAVQAIEGDSGYSHQHPLFPASREGPCL
jgi:flagellar assembly factor FliW